VRVRIGLSMAPREVDIDIEDGEALAAEIEKALAEGQALVWVTDRNGVMHGLASDKIVFIEVESQDSKPGVGFSTD